MMKMLLGWLLGAGLILSTTAAITPGRHSAISPEVLKAVKQSASRSPEFVQDGGPQLPLADQLKVLLKPRLPEQQAFIDKVVLMVGQGTLPRDLVESTMLWAQAKKPYPYPYFEAGLRERAARVGITL